MSGTTRVIAPKDLGNHRIAIAQVQSRKNRDGRTISEVRSIESPLIPTALEHKPNLSLLWQRYMPAHDLKKESLSSPFGVDFEDLHSYKGVGEAITRWAGYGALRWFVRAAAETQKKIAFGTDCLLEKLSQRRHKPLSADDEYSVLRVYNHWRTAVGLGNPATFEYSGASWHHTYGFPILPGSALKGLARHYFEEQFLFERDVPLNDLLAKLDPVIPLEEAADLLFGHSTGGDGDSRDEDESPPGAEAASPEDGTRRNRFGEGVIAFHDGWPIASPRLSSQAREADSWLDVDVLTVHHRNYYNQERPDAVDTEDPNPVHFLTLRPGVAFEIPLTIIGSGRRYPRELQSTFLDIVKGILLLALDEWGLGGKTGAGYGRMLLLPSDGDARSPKDRETHPDRNPLHEGRSR